MLAGRLAIFQLPSLAVVLLPMTVLLASSTCTIQPGRRVSPLSSWPLVGPSSSQAVPETDALACTTTRSRQALCSTAGSQAGRPAGLLAKRSRSSALGPRTGISPPPSTITALSTGEAACALAATLTDTAIGAVPLAPAAITVDVLQLKLLAPTAALHDQPLPLGVAASVRPAGSRSLTV